MGTNRHGVYPTLSEPASTQSAKVALVCPSDRVNISWTPGKLFSLVTAPEMEL